MNDITIIYLHGFASGPASFKGRLLRERLPGHRVLTPDLGNIPVKSIPIVRELLNENRPAILVGSSMGGFVADHFNRHFNTPCVLLNPLVDPEALAPWIGTNTNLHTGEEFSLARKDIDHMHTLLNEKSVETSPKSPEYVMVSRDDEVLDYRTAERYFTQDHQLLTLHDTGGHSLEGLETEIVNMVLRLIDALDNNDWRKYSIQRQI